MLISIPMLVMIAVMWSSFAGAMAIRRNRAVLPWMCAGLAFGFIPLVVVAGLPGLSKR